MVGPFAPDASEQDRSLLGLELEEDVSRTRLTGAMTAAGFAPGMVLLRRDPGARIAHALVEVEGHVVASDTRLAVLDAASRPLVLGGYAVPRGCHRRRRMTTPRPRAEVLTISPYIGGESDTARHQPHHQAVVERRRVRRAPRCAGGDPSRGGGRVPLS